MRISEDELIQLNQWAAKGEWNANQCAKVMGGPPELADEDVPHYQSIQKTIADLRDARAVIRSMGLNPKVHNDDLIEAAKNYVIEHDELVEKYGKNVDALFAARAACREAVEYIENHPCECICDKCQPDRRPLLAKLRAVAGEEAKP